MSRTVARSSRLFLLMSICLLGACRSPSEMVHHKDSGAIGPYSGSVEVLSFCFASGKIGMRGGDFKTEAATAIDAVARELQGADLELKDIVSCTVYLTDISLYAEFNAVYQRLMPKPYPARTCVAVKALPGAARVEIQAIARRK